MQTQYDTWTRRIAALDTDIGRALGSLEKQVPKERRGEVVAEREKVAVQMREIEALLTVSSDRDDTSPLPHSSEMYTASSAGQRRVRLTVHMAYFVADGTPCYFINATNLSDRDIEITHVWFDGEPQIPVLQPDRLLPVRLRPDESWETWMELARLPGWVHEDP